MKKILSLLLSVCLVVTLIPAISFAADEGQGQDNGYVTQLGEQEGDVDLVEQEPAEPEADPEAVDPNAVDPDAPAQDVEAASDEAGPAVIEEDDSDVLVEEPAMDNQVQAMADPGQWVKDDYGWRYLAGGNYLTGLQTIGASTYLFSSPDGYMQIGPQSFDGKKYYFDPNGNDPSQPGSTYGVRKTGWVTVPNVGKCYFNPEMKYGWQAIGGKKYYLNPTTGVVKTGWLTLSGKKYYLDPSSGAMWTGKKAISGKTYYFNTTTGIMQTGWQTISGKKYYFDPTTGIMKTGLQTIGSSKYYFSSAGIMLTGWRTINKKKYYFNPSSGKMQVGWATIDGNRYYFKSSGLYTTGWASIGGSKYYFQSTGIMKKGWLTLNKKKYYLNKSTGKMTKGWATISKKKYFFDTKTGAMTKGWLKYKGKKYYMDKKTGVLKTGLQKVSGTYYFFNKKNGAMTRNSAVKISGKVYYFQNSGKARMKKGWFKDNKKNSHYSLGNGVVATGTKQIGGIWYVFSTANGVLLKTIGDDIDKKVQSKTSNTGYLVVVYRAKYQVRIYTGSKNNWTKKQKFDCAIGMASTPTPAGTYTITKKGESNKYMVNGVQTRYYYYCYYFNQKQGIHSGLYYEGTGTPGTPYDTRVNVKSTSGGVRVSYNNAQWIFYNVPVNTTVVVY